MNDHLTIFFSDYRSKSASKVQYNKIQFQPETSSPSSPIAAAIRPHRVREWEEDAREKGRPGKREERERAWEAAEIVHILYDCRLHPGIAYNIRGCLTQEYDNHSRIVDYGKL